MTVTVGPAISDPKQIMQSRSYFRSLQEVSETSPSRADIVAATHFIQVRGEDEVRELNLGLERAVEISLGSVVGCCDRRNPPMVFIQPEISSTRFLMRWLTA